MTKIETLYYCLTLTLIVASIAVFVITPLTALAIFALIALFSILYYIIVEIVAL